MNNLSKEKKILYLGKNLNYLINKNSIDFKNLSLATGIPTPTILRLAKGGSNPTISTIEPLLDFFRIDIESLLYKDLSNPEYQKRKKLGELVHISVFTLEELSKGVNAKVGKFIAAAGITGEKSFGVEINSDSLAPAFQSNSIIIIDPELQPCDADYVLCQLDLDSNMPLFRQVFFDGSDCYFKPINPGFGEMKFYEVFKIIGVVIKSIESYR